MKKEKIQEFILQASIIRKEEYKTPSPGLIIPDYVFGPKYDKWMNSIKIFAQRNLKEHELYENIIKAYSIRSSNSLTALDDMLGYLETIYSDDEFFIDDALRISGEIMSDKNQNVIFISHKSDDKKYGHAIAKLFRGLGVKNEQLIYTTHPLHKIPLNKNIYEYLKSRLSSNTYMIFLLSDIYFTSSPCLNEMGAAWLVHSDYTIIFVPGFDFQNKKFIECALDNKQMGISLDGSEMFKQGTIELRDKIISMFDLSVDDSSWQYLFDEFISEIK